MTDRSTVRRAFVSLPCHLVIINYTGPILNQIHFTEHLFVWCLFLSHFFESLILPPSESGAISLVSCSERNLKGSGINKRKASQTKLQWGFGRHAGSGAMCTHKRSLWEWWCSVFLWSTHTVTHITIPHAAMVHRDKVDYAYIFNTVVHKYVFLMESSLNFSWCSPHLLEVNVNC